MKDNNTSQQPPWMSAITYIDQLPFRFICAITAHWQASSLVDLRYYSPKNMTFVCLSATRVTMVYFKNTFTVSYSIMQFAVYIGLICGLSKLQLL